MFYTTVRRNINPKVILLQSSLAFMYRANVLVFGDVAAVTLESDLLEMASAASAKGLGREGDAGCWRGEG